MTLNSCVLLVCLVGVLGFQATLATICHSCEDNTCVRTSAVNTTKTCTGACVALFDGYVPTKKGCYSDLSTTEKMSCDSEADVSCYQCSVDRCNNLGRIDHKCKECIGTSSNSTCLNDIQSMADTRCYAPRTNDVFCSTSVLNGNTTRKACIMTNREIKECLESPTTCSICSVTASGACNTVLDFPANRRKCLYCTGENCELTNVTTTSAMSRYCPRVDDRCVSAQVHGVFTRMCEGEISPMNLTYCTTYNTSCVYCSTNDCNTAIPPNSATVLFASLKVLTAVAVAVMLSSKQ